MNYTTTDLAGKISDRDIRYIYSVIYALIISKGTINSKNF